MNPLENLILTKDLILIGELHGTKEIPEFLLNLIKKVSKKTNFLVCLEIPKSSSKDLRRYFLEERFKDGRASRQYFHFIKTLKRLGIKTVFIDDDANNQQEKENLLAKHICDLLNKKTKVIAILGDVHAYKKPFSFAKKKIFPTGYILSKTISNMASIRIIAKKGNIFNFGIKKVLFSASDPIDKGFDFIYVMESFSPCNFVGGRNKQP